ncbi:MAG TPA: hypothetical protein IGS40_13545 [Trichormus sp. M33_DOE_039]|nr:hypothetical protein [Trichormus sp. M33_DOE_039]
MLPQGGTISPGDHGGKAVSSSRQSRRHLLQVGKAAQRSVSPTQCLPNGLPPQDRADSPVTCPLFKQC